MANWLADAVEQVKIVESSLSIAAGGRDTENAEARSFTGWDAVNVASGRIERLGQSGREEGEEDSEEESHSKEVSKYLNKL